MLIDSDKWITASEAARLLRVSAERVRQLSDDGSLESARPWPRVSLVTRESVAAWIAGQRQRRMSQADARRYVLQVTDRDDIAGLNPNVVRDHVRDFVVSARPRWGDRRTDEYALDLASRLLASTAAGKDR